MDERSLSRRGLFRAGLIATGAAVGGVPLIDSLTRAAGAGVVVDGCASDHEICNSATASTAAEAERLACALSKAQAAQVKCAKVPCATGGRCVRTVGPPAVEVIDVSGAFVARCCRIVRCGCEGGPGET